MSAAAALATLQSDDVYGPNAPRLVELHECKQIQCGCDRVNPVGARWPVYRLKAITYRHEWDILACADTCSTPCPPPLCRCFGQVSGGVAVQRKTLPGLPWSWSCLYRTIELVATDRVERNNTVLLFRFDLKGTRELVQMTLHACLIASHGSNGNG